MPRSMLRVVAVGLAMALLAFAGSTARADEPRADLVYVDRGDIGTLDTNRMSWMQDIRVGYALWEGLYALDSKTLEPAPGAAEKVVISADQLTYTFTLRADGKWSNGDPVTSGDFVFAWRRMLQEPGDYTYLFDYIVGANDYQKAFAADPASADWSKVGVKTPDARTIIVTLVSPVSYLPDVLAFPPFFPLNEKSMAEFKVDDGKGRTSYKAGFARPPHLVTNGPFTLTRWELKVGLSMVKNPHYWDKANVASNSIEVLAITDPQLAYEKYQRGEVDWLADTSANLAAQLRDQGRKDMRIFPSFGTYFWSLNCLPKLPDGRKNPMSDVRVRQALAMAIDRRPIVKNVTKLGEEITNRYVPPSFPTYTPPTGLPLISTTEGAKPIIEQAKAKLAEAGFPDGKGFPTLRVIYNSDVAEHRMIAEQVTRQWKRNLGIEVSLDGIELKQFQTRLHAKDYEIARASWYGDYYDVSTFSDKYKSDSLNNDAGWVNGDYDRLLADAAKEIDPVKRLAILSKAEGILINEVPIIPLYHYVNRWVMRDNVQGLPTNPRAMVSFKRATAGRSK